MATVRVTEAEKNDEDSLFFQEEQRIMSMTLQGWHHETLSAAAVGSSGFFMLEDKLHVKCPFCKLVAVPHDKSFDPHTYHIEKRPNCRYVKGWLKKKH
ncbi:uncharacterized protein E0L32_009959 [Thyridium curvatum]|uniref:Uncharacterized protein n=1 Tax=Thyridium curvatum TaxID=1093900 RepID=A0A507AWH8_9PEZI|nr:uncharacterized protein E0L32_009959 [Thyridium curvatum]TPX08620.1 hypothetical protein E0L32_009959 [Thyridium curvatum]